MVGPVEGRPVQLDDTCYLLPCESAAEAAVLTALCAHPDALGLIEALSFPGAKRHLTKGLLQRLDLSAILRRTDRPELIDRAHALLAELPGRAIEPEGAIAQQVESLERRFREAAAPANHEP